jgi:hypothetical protein
MSVMALPLSNLIRLALTVFLMVASQIWTRFAGRKISAARFGRRLAIAPICCLARMANLPRLGRSGLPSGSKPLTRYGLKSQRRLICPKRWPKWQAPPQFQVATGERLCSKYEFSRVLQCGAAAILQPNLGRAGGILEGKKIAAIAEPYYAQIAPHLYCGPVVAAANIQLAASIPNF